jgi:hypothetical protein
MGALQKVAREDVGGGSKEGKIRIDPMSTVPNMKQK